MPVFRVSEPVLCSHGREGFCWDDASPEGRERFAALYRHAYDYADSVTTVPDRAEEYAAWFAADNYHAHVDAADAHPRAFEEWLRQSGLTWDDVKPV